MTNFLRLSHRQITHIPNLNFKIKIALHFTINSKKGTHYVPTTSYGSASSFIQQCASRLIEEEIKGLSAEIQKRMNYKRRELGASSEGGYGTINSPGFTYTIEVFQSDEDLGDYFLERRLTKFENSKAIVQKDINSVFAEYFDELEFDLPNTIDVDEIIDIIEDIDEGPISVIYDHLDTSSCKINIEGLPCSIKITEDSITVI